MQQLHTMYYDYVMLPIYDHLIICICMYVCMYVCMIYVCMMYVCMYCIVLYLNTCYSAPHRFPIQRRSRLLRGR